MPANLTLPTELRPALCSSIATICDYFHKPSSLVANRNFLTI